MRYLSLFSGIEAASVAWEPLGWEPVAFSEIEPFPCHVLDARYPGVPNLGDICGITKERLDALGPIDLIVGGSPCQGFSNSGYRKGLDDARSKLAIKYIRVIHDVLPRWIVWENVPGVFSVNGGMDFRCFTRQITELGYCIGWRVLDAQYFGVPQMRRRVFLVGYRGAEPVKRVTEVLFEPEGVRGDPAPCPSQGQSTASGDGGNTRSSMQCFDITHACDVVRTYDDKTFTLSAHMGTGGNNVPLVYSQLSFYSYKEGAPVVTLTARGGSLSGGSNALPVTGNRLRRLTPEEGLMLQGFPADYFRYVLGYTDTGAYKAIGNSMATPCMKWIGEHIQTVENKYGYTR